MANGLGCGCIKIVDSFKKKLGPMAALKALGGSSYISFHLPPSFACHFCWLLSLVSHIFVLVLAGSAILPRVLLKQIHVVALEKNGHIMSHQDGRTCRVARKLWNCTAVVRRIAILDIASNNFDWHVLCRDFASLVKARCFWLSPVLHEFLQSVANQILSLKWYSLVRKRITFEAYYIQGTIG